MFYCRINCWVEIASTFCVWTLKYFYCNIFHVVTDVMLFPALISFAIITTFYRIIFVRKCDRPEHPTKQSNNNSSDHYSYNALGCLWSLLRGLLTVVTALEAFESASACGNMAFDSVFAGRAKAEWFEIKAKIFF